MATTTLDVLPSTHRRTQTAFAVCALVLAAVAASVTFNWPAGIDSGSSPAGMVSSSLVRSLTAALPSATVAITAVNVGEPVVGTSPLSRRDELAWLRDSEPLAPSFDPNLGSWVGPVAVSALIDISGSFVHVLGGLDADPAALAADKQVAQFGTIVVGRWTFTTSTPEATKALAGPSLGAEPAAAHLLTSSDGFAWVDLGHLDSLAKAGDQASLAYAASLGLTARALYQPGLTLNGTIAISTASLDLTMAAIRQDEGTTLPWLTSASVAQAPAATRTAALRVTAAGKPTYWNGPLVVTLTPTKTVSQPVVAITSMSRAKGLLGTLYAEKAYSMNTEASAAGTPQPASWCPLVKDAVVQTCVAWPALNDFVATSDRADMVDGSGVGLPTSVPAAARTAGPTGVVTTSLGGLDWNVRVLF